MKNTYTKDLTPGLALSEETFALAEHKTATDRNGNQYYDLVLADKTGEVKAKVWSDSVSNVEKAALVNGKVVAVTGLVDEYRGKAQINVQRLAAVNENDLAEYMESSAFDTEEMWQELENIVADFEDQELKTFTQNLLSDKSVADKLKVWPAGIRLHHGFRSGLLQHILEMLHLATGIEKFYPDANFDLVRTGIIIHDIGKLTELDGGGLSTQYTKIGSLLGHMQLGIELIEPCYPEDFPEAYKAHLKHIILSHHGALEFGSPVLPSTVEAMLVSDLDSASSNARKAATALEKNLQDDGMSEFDWRMGVRYWNGQSV